MAALVSLLERVAQTDVPVLVCGETGTGKGFVARAIHAASQRSDGPFIECDLSAIAPSLIESELFGHLGDALSPTEPQRPGAFVRAEGGTLFLDEIGELAENAESAQPRLLRAIERRELSPAGSGSMRAVDVRVIAATSRDLAVEVAAGRFRGDLYHRLAVVVIEVPPLRERREDIPELTAHLLAELAAARGRLPPTVSAEALDLFQQYDWPGNVRELRNVLERAMSLAPDALVLSWDLLRVEAPPKQSGTHRLFLEWKTFKEAKDQLLDEWEREYLREVLERSGGNMTLAARYAGIARGHLYRLMKKHRLCR